MTLKRLPDCDRLFKRFFDSWYSDDERKRKIFEATRPDAQQYARPGTPANKVSPLTIRGQISAKKHIAAMLEAATGDFPTYLKVSGKPNIQWVHAFDKYYDRDAVLSLVNRSDPSDFTNDYLVICCEFGALMGDVFIQRRRHLKWLPDWPYWESSIYDSRSGYRIAVFHWAIKKLSSYGLKDGYRSKLLGCVDLIDREWK